MKTRIKWTGGVAFLGETGSGHTVAMDGAPEAGGRNLAPRPMEMVLAGLGGCSSFDVVKLLRDAGQDVQSVELELDAERAAAEPAVFTAINGHFIVKGKSVSDAEVDKAVSLSARRLSSVARMLEHTAVIRWDYEVVQL